MSDELGGGAWHPDPFGRFPQRWYTGVEWTDQVVDAAGAVAIDPMGSAAGAAPGAASPPPPPLSPPPPGGFAPGAAPGYQPPGAVPGYQPPGAVPPGVVPPGTSWATPAPFGQPMAPKSSGLAVAALVLGIGSLLVSLVPVLGFVSVPFALGGAGLGIAAIIQTSKGRSGKGMAIAGLVTSILALVVSVLWFTLFASIDDSDGFNSDPSNGICNQDRFWQDPDC